MRHAIAAVLLSVVFLLPAAATSGSASGPVFRHATLDSLLRRHVDGRGRVDYAGLAHERPRLDRYLSNLAHCSPDNCAARFPTRADALAYWINAYNAFVLRGVLDAWPLGSVADVAGGLDGFFHIPRFVAGGDTLSLDDVESGIIRPRFRDPRIHFAVNCGAASCPPLDARAYAGNDLEEHLDRQARRFAADPANVRVDGTQVWLSRLLDWYGQDFVQWFPRGQAPTGTTPSLVEYVRIYADAEMATRLPPADKVEIHFLDYDWSLNAQVDGGPRGTAP